MIQLVSFRIGRETFGMEIGLIREIIIPEAVTTAPNLPDFVEGIIDLRGVVIPIVDLRRRFRTSDPHPTGRVIITESGGEAIGLRVDEVNRVTRVDENLFRKPPRLLTAASAFVSSVYERPAEAGGGLILLLDINKLFSEEEWRAVGVDKIQTFNAGISTDSEIGARRD